MRGLIASLTDARDYARQAAHHVDGIGFAEFISDELRRQAVCFCLLVVGEACIQAAKESPTLPADVPWGEIRGMRNLLVHEYWQIDDEIIYNVARREAEPLARRLDGLINEVAQRT